MSIQELWSETVQTHMKDYFQMALVKIHIHIIWKFLFFARGGYIKVMFLIYICPDKVYLGQNWKEVNCEQYFSK